MTHTPGRHRNQTAHFLIIDAPIKGNRVRSIDDGNFIAVYFGRLVRFTSHGSGSQRPHCIRRSALQLTDGSARPLIRTFDVKMREYYGNTSMDAEISLLMANQALVRM